MRRRPSARGRRALRRWAVLAAAVALAAAACAEAPVGRPQQVTAGNPEFGERALQEYGCVECHVIPGIAGADAHVGPPLDHFGLRSYIAGSLENNQENLIRWITDPQGVEPGTAMPDLYVTRDDAVNMSAYLLGLD